MNDPILYMGGFALLAVVVCVVVVLYVRGLTGDGGSARKGSGRVPDDEHKGAEGVVRALRRYAAARDFAVIAPVKLAGTKDAADLDALLVGWFGVLGVKCLGYGGEVYGGAGEAQWVQTENGGRRSFENPIDRAAKSARAVRDVLFEAKLKNVPVETAVVFTNRAAQLKLPRSTGHYTEKAFLEYLRGPHFDEDKKVEVEPVARALRGDG